MPEAHEPGPNRRDPSAAVKAALSRPLGRRRHVVLVALDWTRPKDPRSPLGHASLVAALNQARAVEVSELSFAVNESTARPDDIARQILARANGVPSRQVDVAIGVYVWNEPLVVEVLRALRQSGFAGRIGLGGPQITYAGPDLEARYPEADFFIRGTAESALASVAAADRRVDVPGVHWAGDADDGVVAQVDPSTLPSPFLSGVIDVRGQRFLRWETQRGCPYSCSFCQHRAAKERFACQAFALDRLRREIALFVEAGVEDIAVLDPVFNLGKTDLPVLEEFRRLGFRGRLSLQCRAERVQPAFLDACAGMDVRLEFGLQTIHAAEADAVLRRNDLDRIDGVLAEVRRRGIKHEVSLIYGLPEQTLGSFLASVEWCLARRVPVVKAFPLLLLRGTQLAQTSDRWALRVQQGGMPAVVASDSFDEHSWRQMARVADALAATEGRHPANVEELLRRAESCTPAQESMQQARHGWLA